MIVIYHNSKRVTRVVSDTLEVIDFDSKKRAVNLKGDELRSKRNSLSSEIGNLMRNGGKQA